MKTECKEESYRFQDLGRRQVVADFEGGRLSSDARALLLRQVEERFGVIEQLASCFEDRRGASLIEHSVRDLVGQRVMGLALGYEDLNDHDALRRDPLLALAVGKSELLGQERVSQRDKGKGFEDLRRDNSYATSDKDALGICSARILRNLYRDSLPFLGRGEDF